MRRGGRTGDGHVVLVRVSGLHTGIHKGALQPKMAMDEDDDDDDDDDQDGNDN